jgi:uncharacterized DUF497 family protein
MEFDWNPAKCAKNVAERGIDFADVVVARKANQREQRCYEKS